MAETLDFRCLGCLGAASGFLGHLEIQNTIDGDLDGEI